MAKVLIVGAGAAGLMAAGAAVRQGHQVTVLEHMEKPGQKILVTGKGRCNVTNDCPAEEFLRHVRTNPRFLYSSLGAFPPAKTMELFEAFPLIRLSKTDMSWSSLLLVTLAYICVVVMLDRKSVV